MTSALHSPFRARPAGMGLRFVRSASNQTLLCPCADRFLARASESTGPRGHHAPAGIVEDARSRSSFAAPHVEVEASQLIELLGA